MSILKKLAGETVIYGISSILGRFLNYLLVPFYTRVFLPEEFGVVTELYAYAAFLNVVFTFGMETSYFRYCNKEGADKADVFQSIQSLLIFSTFLLCGNLILFSHNIANALQYPHQSSLIISLVLVIGVDTLLVLSFAKLRQEGRAKKFAFVKLFNIMLNIGLNIWFLLVLPKLDATFQPNVSYVFIANLIANLAQMLFFPKDIIGWIRFSIPWNTVKTYLAYGFPLMVMGLAGMTNEVIDRMLLKFLLPHNFYPGQSQLAALGIYGACYKLSIFMSLGIQAFRYAAEPFFFSRATDKRSPDLYARVLHYFTFVSCAVFVLISFNLDWIQFLLGRPEYRQGLQIVPILLAANMFLGIYYNLSIWYKLTDRTSYGMWISIGGGIVTLVLNLIFIPRFGYVACAWATFICYGLMALTSYILGQKYFPIPYRIPYMLILLITSSLLSIAFWDVQFDEQNTVDIFYKNGVAASTLLALFILGKKLKVM